MDIDTLKKHVESVDHDFTVAVSFHETWKPMALDDELHKRMGKSYATQVFLVIRSALRRELILALMRIWDTTTKSYSLDKIFAELIDPQAWRELLAHRARERPYGFDLISEHLVGQKKEVCELYSKYVKGGERYESLRRLLKLRHGTLAHTQAPSREVASLTPVDDVDAFYEDTGLIVTQLMSLVCGVAVNYEDTKGIYAFYARFFWENARGEFTEGHPRFRGSD